jgi:hypothetical protein
LLKDLGEFYEMAMVGVFMKADIFLRQNLILVIFKTVNVYQNLVCKP